MPNLLPETVSISLDVGARLAVFGANESGITQFRVAGEDRYEFFNAGQARSMVQLPTKNFGFALVNGRLPEETLSKIETACDRSGVCAILITEGGGPLVETMTKWPRGNSKGVVNLDVVKVIKRIDLREPPIKPPPRKDPPPPPKPPDPPPPPPRPDPAPPQPGQSMEEVLGQMEQFYDQFNGDHNKIINHIRELGVTEGQKSFKALYQRILGIRNRRKQPGNTNGDRPAVHQKLLESELGKQLLAAAENATTANQIVVDLATQLATENQSLKEVVTAQSARIESLAAIEAENALLKKQLQPFLDAAAAIAKQ